MQSRSFVCGGGGGGRGVGVEEKSEKKEKDEEKKVEGVAAAGGGSLCPFSSSFLSFSYFSFSLSLSSFFSSCFLFLLHYCPPTTLFFSSPPIPPHSLFFIFTPKLEKVIFLFLWYNLFNILKEISQFRGARSPILSQILKHFLNFWTSSKKI